LVVKILLVLALHYCTGQSNINDGSNNIIDFGVTVVIGYVTSAGARKPPRVRRRVARCVSPYSTDSNYEGPETAPRRRPQRRRQPRHQQGTSAGTGSTASTGDARLAATGEAQPLPGNNARPRPPPIAAKPRGTSNHLLHS